LVDALVSNTSGSDAVPVRSRLRVLKQSESESIHSVFSLALTSLLTARMAGPSDQNPAGGGIPRGAGLQGCVDALVSNTGPIVKKLASG
jgi:hypothetical protein